MKVRILNLVKIAWLPLGVCWLGAGLNILVVRANSGMPAANLDFSYGRWVPLNSNTKYPYLADVIPILDYQASLGDILMYLAVGIWLYIAAKYIVQSVREMRAGKLSWF